MFFTVENNKYLSSSQLKTNALMKAYFVISNFPLKASDKVLDDYIQQQHKISLKNLCIRLLLNLSFLKNDEGGYTLLFKDPELDKLAQLVTYGNGAIPGSRILQIALKN